MKKYQKSINNNNSIWSYFKFSCKNIFTNPFVYLSIIFYGIIILSYSILIPYISHKPPIRLFSSTISTLFLMLLSAAIISIISVEIFRTPIDDGTELLIVSKPVNRKEIIIVKLSVFLLSVMVLSFLAMIIASFTFVNKSSTYDESLTITLGVFVGTFVNTVLFGSITTILSIYSKKVIAMIITIGIAFIFMVVSFLGTFVIKSPAYIMQQKGYNITPIKIINSNNENQNNNQLNLSVISGGFSTSIDKNSTIESVWRQAEKESPNKIFSFFDFGYHLGSLFSLSKAPDDVQETYEEMVFSNLPATFNFSNFNYNANSMNFSIGLDLINWKPTLPPEVPTLPPDTIIKNPVINLTPITTQNTRIYLSGGWNSKWKYTISTDIISSVKDWQTLWNDNWKKYGGKKHVFDTNEKPKTLTSPNAVEENQNVESVNDFLTNFFADKTNNSLSDLKYSKTLINLNKIQIAAYAKLADMSKNGFLDLIKYMTIVEKPVEPTPEPTPPNNQPKENTGNQPIIPPDILNKYIIKVQPEMNVLLGLIGINIPASLEEFINIDINNLFNNSNLNKKPSFLYQDDENKIKSYDIELSTKYIPIQLLSNFQQISTRSLLNKNYTIPTWIAISLIVFSVAIVLYFRRDFA